MHPPFVKGRTTNHATWVMVDATDFATPESAASAATTIKIYGKLRANDTVQFVSSGTGSLTNDIKHVGASATGRYTIGLVKADLSDASAAWYDQYIIGLSCTGCALNTLVIDGGIDLSAASALQSRVSDIQSYLVALSGLVSDVQSGVAVANSRVLIAQSGASDAASAAAQANSRVLLVQSRLSDLDSRLASDTSDLYSLLSDLQSDFQSRVPKAVATNSQLLLTQSLASDAHSAAAQANSRVLLTQSLASDAHSAATLAASRALLVQSTVSDIYSLLSDVGSDVTVMSGVVSDIYSNLAAGVAVGASDMSDIRSAITANGVLRAGADPTTVVAAAGTLAAKVDWMTALARNKILQTATVQSLRNDGDSADIASAAVSDDGVTFTRDEFA